LLSRSILSGPPGVALNLATGDWLPLQQKSRRGMVHKTSRISTPLPNTLICKSKSRVTRVLDRRGRDIPNLGGTGGWGGFGARPLISLFAVVAIAIGTAQAHQMLYDQDGYKLAVGIEAGLGGFVVGNVDTGAGNVNTNAPLEEAFSGSVARGARARAISRPFP